MTEDQKSERRQTIIEGAEAQLRRVSVEDFSMEVLARELGIARGTLYRYFETREALLLTLYERQQAAFIAALKDSVHEGISDAAFVRCWYELSNADPLFLKLRARLEAVIEHNVSAERLIQTKLAMQATVTALSAWLAGRLALTEAQAQRLIFAFAALSLGAAQADASPRLDRRHLSVDVRNMLDLLASERLFRDNALLILEGIRRRK